jgi:ketosteroid isomerase-like protein
MPDGHNAAKSWVRATGCYRKIEGRWRIVHEQVSVPFDPRTSQAVFSLEA